MQQLSSDEIILIARNYYDLSIKDVKLIPSGINYVFLLDGKYILKEYVKVKSPQIEKIHTQLVELKRNGLCIPPILANKVGDFLTNIDGRNVDISRYIDHIDLSDQVNIPDENLQLAAKTLFHIQSSINITKVAEVIPKMDFVKTFNDTLNSIEHYKSSFEKIYWKANESEKSKLNILKKLIFQTDSLRARGQKDFASFFNQKYVPTHGDYSMLNVLISRNGKIYVIDWDNLALRPMLWDLQASISLFSLEETGNAYLLEPDFRKAKIFIKSFLSVANISKAELRLLPEIVKYNYAIYWLSYTLPAVNNSDFRLLFLIPDSVEKGLYWQKNLQKYSQLIEEVIQEEL